MCVIVEVSFSPASFGPSFSDIESLGTNVLLQWSIKSGKWIWNSYLGVEHVFDCNA